MKPNILNPRKALNKAFLKVKPNRSEIEAFKINLIQLVDGINEVESEEFHKNLVRDFLKKTYYDPQHFINTKGRNDLVIHTGKHAHSSVGVIVEAKKPGNKVEMLSRAQLNAKALQELVLYFLRERITHHNIEIKHLVATNIYEWFVFDAALFERLFAQNKVLVRQFIDFEAGRLAGTKTDFFYKQIAEPFIAEVVGEIEYTWFNLQDYQRPLRNADKEDDHTLIALFKLLSPEHLLKLPFANDSNSLDKRFYSELLHIIGLNEFKDGGKKIIGRNKPEERHSGSILEDAIIQLDSLDKLSRLPNLKQYGDSTEERLFQVALELSITWINRILFLKLLEAQLRAYHRGDSGYAFLNYQKIKGYDDLNSLFFQVLARRPSERNDDVRSIFANVPYLNSSLFEPTEIEQNSLFISNLKDNKAIPIHAQTVLKDLQGKKRTGQLSTLQYLFEFLNAYDFSSEGSEAIQEDNKTLINASVLGLIFEKINGYKDGSFFTPGFITMYMCRETIRRAVVQKFNTLKNWNCTTLEDLYDRIDNRKEANAIINSLKICDPAVGSGHFLVSALNEIISVKNDLKILEDREGKRLKEYHVEVVNDELIVTDEEGMLFEYRPASAESQRVQETLFHEKQTIIENCLFGVDINPNSVKICRLRLWIELLKNAYYVKNVTSSQRVGLYEDLQTLPNIDINIKCGNSLVSRFAMDADLKQALRKSRYSIDSYQLAVSTYHNAENKEQKREMERLILEIKQSFSTEIRLNDPIKKRLDKLTSELFHRFTGTFLFEPESPYGKDEKALDKKRKTEREKLEKEIEQISAKWEEMKSSHIFENSFEWRFEFPEVLNADGDFVGFDVVIGNPPYMRVQEIQASQPAQKLHYEAHYQNAKAAYDLANLFFELAVNISSENSHNAFIFPHKFFNSASSETFRTYLKEGQYIDEIAHFGANMIFDDADTYTCVAQFSKHPGTGFYFQRFPFKSDFKTRMLDKSKYTFITYEMLQKASNLYGGNQWILFDDKLGFRVFEKIYQNSKLISEIFEGVFQGIATSKDELYAVECIDEHTFTVRVPVSGREYVVERELFKPFLMGKDVHRYSHLSTNKYVFFPYLIVEDGTEVISVEDLKSSYPRTFEYVMDHENFFKGRESGKAGQMKHWHAYIYPKNLNKFEQPKLSSMEICANHPNVIFNLDHYYHPTTVYSWVKKDSTLECYEYLLAVANSKLLWWFIKITGDTLQGDARRFKTNYLNPFPLPEFVSPEKEKVISDKVKDLITIKRSAPESDTSSLESHIDQLVYALYGLTEEEIAVVEAQ